MESARYLLAIVPLMCFAQQPDEPPLALLRGEVVLLEGAGFSIRAADYRVHRYQTDERTWIERDNARVAFDTLRRGDIVDVVADRVPGVARARLIKLVLTRPLARAAPPAWRTHNIPSSLLARGTQTHTGVVTRLSDERLVLRLRNGERKSFQLRYDTAFRVKGRLGDRSDLSTQTRVFVRAGKNLYDEDEVYEVVWGEILQPDEPR